MKMTKKERDLLASVDLRGKTFGQLTVVMRDDDRRGAKGMYWDCKCECGKYASYYLPSLLKGKAKSCGCHLK
jgi:hypothetical protein